MVQTLPEEIVETVVEHFLKAREIDPSTNLPALDVGKAVDALAFAAAQFVAALPPDARPALAGRFLKAFQDEHRSEFSNKEFRLDQTLDLPGIKDNLEARLILLRKRLDERSGAIRIEKVSRGRFRLAVEKPLNLVTVNAPGPM